jgi:FixJ family two-component response regulator
LKESPLISIVDDDDLSRTAVESLVRSRGFTACSFASAESYLRSPSVKKTECLIADVQMPNVDGLQLQEHLSLLGLDTPIIFLTAYPDDAIEARALKAGAVGFLQKGRDIWGGRFFACLQDALANRGVPASHS